ncbi:hypothetical protein Tsubulata_031047 [Turnera subulata]|uniref:Uncharacterized protein n=1 Tax=Turnera subulata TaxID=218843 RepID=A0A9Q0F4Q9_9ROSI|nr:hypothetical protein Tsubulata_031047 [Turnera subulata]
MLASYILIKGSSVLGWFKHNSSCMAAADAAVISSLTILLISFLIMLHSTMANKEEIFSHVTPTRNHEASKKNSIGFGSRRHDGDCDMGNAKRDSSSSSSWKTNHISVPPQISSNRKKGRFRARSSPLPWQEGIFNSGEHEVPSGPNPISNR